MVSDRLCVSVLAVVSDRLCVSVLAVVSLCGQVFSRLFWSRNGVAVSWQVNLKLDRDLTFPGRVGSSSTDRECLGDQARKRSQVTECIPIKPDRAPPTHPFPAALLWVGVMLGVTTWSRSWGCICLTLTG